MRFQTVKIKQSKSFVKTKDLDCLIQTKEKSFVNSQKKMHVGIQNGQPPNFEGWDTGCTGTYSF